MQQDAPGRNKPDITYSQQINVRNLYTFLAVICVVQKLYWTKDEFYCIPLHSSMMPHDPVLTILKYLQFMGIQNPPTQNIDDADYNRLWKVRQIFDILNSKFSELYLPTEHIAVDEVIIKLKGKVAYRQYIPPPPKKRDLA
jgi:hypothetical protein